MRLVKLFKALEVEVDVLEQKINQWIAAQGGKIQVLQVTGNIAPQSEAPGGKGGGLGSAGNASDVLIVILYEKL